MPRRTVLQLWIHPFQAHRHTLTLFCQGASPVQGSLLLTTLNVLLKTGIPLVCHDATFFGTRKQFRAEASVFTGIPRSPPPSDEVVSEREVRGFNASNGNCMLLSFPRTTIEESSLDYRHIKFVPRDYFCQDQCCMPSRAAENRFHTRCC